MYLGTVCSEASRQENSVGCSSYIAWVYVVFRKVSRSPFKDPDHGVVCRVPRPHQMYLVYWETLHLSSFHTGSDFQGQCWVVADPPISSLILHCVVRALCVWWLSIEDWLTTICHEVLHTVLVPPGSLSPLSGAGLFLYAVDFLVEFST